MPVISGGPKALPTPPCSAGPSGSRARVPAHLRNYVVDQAYDEYNAVDQAVWRFVLEQIYDTLRHTAHPAYEHGLAQTGISTDHIPSIAEMDRKLTDYGWGAVCVDGFIPPRAFVEFQALGLLPIAADMRSKRHLVYTPAPDIIHEAAGHAPIIPDEKYAAYLKQIGAIGRAAFSSPEDERVYRAIYTLSEVKEQPDATAEQIRRAELAFEEATSSVTHETEATRMSRLYWWTAEYGLVGTPSEYKLYGAGLLSSLGESHSCHGPEVRKIPLSVECLDVSYDITRQQPQLFVARDFEHLNDVLSEASRSLSCCKGGIEGLREAQFSADLCTLGVEQDCSEPFVDPVQLDRQELGILGTVEGFLVHGEGQRSFLEIQLRGPLGIARRGRLSLASGELPAEARVIVCPATHPLPRQASSASYETELAGGATLRGVVARPELSAEGRLLLLTLKDACIGDRPLLGTTFLCPGELVSVSAGALDGDFYPATDFTRHRVPSPRRFDVEERELIDLFDETSQLVDDRLGTEGRRRLIAIHEELRERYPEEWLLRWNLLEGLLRAGQLGTEAKALREELEHLELRFAHKEPIAMGLAYLSRLVA